MLKASVALSAVMCHAETPVSLPTAKSGKPKAVEGVFGTMMTASRQASKPAAAACSSAHFNDTSETFSRASEQALLSRAFSHVLTPASQYVQLPKSGQAKRTDWSVVATAVATAVDHAQSLWKRVSQHSPPACTLQQRVHKRKAQQAIVQEQARQDALVQQCAAAEAMLGACDDAEQSQAPCQGPGQGLSGPQPCTGPCTGLQPPPACINLVLSPEQNSQLCCVGAHSQKRAVLSTGSQQSHDPMKRVRLLALRQELKAAKQTVTDLERMILEVEQG